MKKIRNRLPAFLCIFIVSLGILPLRALAGTELEPITAPAAILVDTYDGSILYDKNSREQRPPASITKVMTALLVLEAMDRGELQADTMITASANAVADLTKDSSTQNIQPGEQMSVENLLYCLLCPSANEAANILAEAVSGDVPAFVEKMNARAAELGMTSTHFVNPHGLHNDRHYSSAYDIYLMVKQAMTNPLFQKIVATTRYTVPATNLSGERTFTNTNALLTDRKFPGYTYSFATGVKTGSTLEAGFCLASSAQKNGRTLIAVVLGGKNIANANGGVTRLQFLESIYLFKWGFSNFKLTTLVGPDTLMREVPVDWGKQAAHVVAVPSKTIEAILPVDYNAELLTTDITLSQDKLRAPVAQNQTLGTIQVTYDGKDYGSVDLVASNAVERSIVRMFVSMLKTLFTSPILWLGALALLILAFLRYRRALNRTPRGKRNSNIDHIDSARGNNISHRGGKPKPPR